MKINLTKKQFESLAKVVYLGNWMANAHRTGGSGDPLEQEYEDIADYIFSLAPEFGYGEHFEHDLEYTEDLKPTKMSLLHEEYDEENFWDELCDRMGTKEFERRYSSEAIEAMSDEEQFVKLHQCIAACYKEAEDHGIDRLEFMKQAKDFGIGI